jgi:hypothetical protein
MPTLLNYKRRRRKSYATIWKGELVGVNGRTDKPAKNIVIRKSNAYAIGRDTHGWTIIGIKGRVGFEAAAPNHHQSAPFIRNTPLVNGSNTGKNNSETGTACYSTKDSS